MPIDKLSANAFATGAVANSLGYTPANQAGDTFTGTVTANTLVVSTNTATIGTTVYSVSNGNVGIGTATPGAGFDVAYSGIGAALRVYNSQATDPYGLLVDNTGANTSDANYIADFRVGGTSKFSIKNSGLIDVPAGQIKFPATQNASSDANTLDDYEEGSWTPRNSSGTALPINNSATYIKIGRLVFVNADINQLNQATVYGLPFTSASTGYPGVVSVGYSGYQNQTLTGEFNGGTTTLSLRYNGYIDITPSNNRFIIAGCYVASA